MNSTKKSILTVVITALVTGTAVYVHGFTAGKVLKSQALEAEAKMKALKEQEERDELLGQYAINMMMQTPAKTKISDARKQVLARSIVKVSNDVFDSNEHKKAFIAVIAIESQFMKYAQSPTGPKGLTQVAKAAFKEGMENCGIANTNEDDVWETDLNLYAGACYFRKMMENHNNDPYIAIVAYNQGPNSKDIKTYSKSGSADSVEALKYIAKFNFLKRTVKEERIPGTPSVGDFSKKKTK